LIVADASAIVEVLLNTPVALEIADHLFTVGQTIHVPYLIDLEILQVLRRYARTGEIGGSRAAQALDDYLDMGLNRHSHAGLAPRIWELRNNWTAYDASYIALAEALKVTLVTRDRALASKGHRAKVLVL
jgi:predicted nucleic acid-binding protein